MSRITTLRTLSLLAAAAVALVGCDEQSDGDNKLTDAATAPMDAPKMIDAMSDAPMTPAGSPATINCGMDMCDRPAEVCCFTGYPNITTQCTAPASCMAPKLPGRCDGPEDCAAGEICCGTMEGSSCVAASACTGTTAARLCHTAADCAMGQICRPSMFVAFPICANN